MISIYSICINITIIITSTITKYYYFKIQRLLTELNGFQRLIIIGTTTTTTTRTFRLGSFFENFTFTIDNNIDNYIDDDINDNNSSIHVINLSI